MRRIDNFSLVTGVIGLIVDIIALGTLFTGLWAKTENITQCSTVCDYLILAVLLLPQLYGWFALGWWSLAKGRERILSSGQKRVRKRTSDTTASRSGTAMGVLILPIYLIWLFAVGSVDVQNHIQYELYDYPFRESAVPLATRIASGEDIPEIPGDVATIDELVSYSVPNNVVIFIRVYLAGIFAYVFFIGPAVVFALSELAKVIYPDLYV